MSVMSHISADNELVTLINVFNVEPQNQDKLIKLLEQATEEVMRHQPGFISANIHRSLGGVRVVNYAQWKSKEVFENMLQNPEAQRHMNEALCFMPAAATLFLGLVLPYNHIQVADWDCLSLRVY
jgi:quinol monooxygenase YgiN